MTATGIRADTEKQWDALLFNSKRGLATNLGWTDSYHTLRSKGSQPGFPDRVLVRDERAIFAELKTDGGRPTERQVFWLNRLARAGLEVYLWRPSDLDDIGRILGRRWVWMGNPKRSLYWAESKTETVWVPDCLWTPDGARWDAVRGG